MGISDSKTEFLHPAIENDTTLLDRIACDVVVDQTNCKALGKTHLQVALMELKFLRYYFDMKCDGKLGIRLRRLIFEYILNQARI